MGLFLWCSQQTAIMADDAAAEMKKKRTFRKYTYRGVDLDQLLDMNNEQLMELFPCRVRRKISRGLKRKPMALIKKLQEEEGVPCQRETRCCQDPLERHDHCPRNDRIRCWCLQWQNF